MKSLCSWDVRATKGCLSADAGRDCTISTPAMNDTRIKVEYVHDEKESVHSAISIRDRTPLQSKTKKKLHLKFHRLRLSQRTADDTILKPAHLVMVHFRGGKPLVASSAKNLLGDSTYLRLDLDETRPAELYSGYPAHSLASNVSSRKRNLPWVLHRARMALHSFNERTPLTSGAYPQPKQRKKHCSET